MQNFLVTQSVDNGQGTTEGSLSWAIKRANETPGNDRITLKTDVALTGEMRQLIDSDVTIEGSGLSEDGDNAFNISGDKTHRPLFINSGTVTINSVDIVDRLANGRIGGSGGAGLGGGLFIYSGNVTLSKVTFENNQAIGGYGGYGNYYGYAIGTDGGNDVLDGGQGRDRLFGGAGNDVLLGGTGNDVLSRRRWRQCPARRRRR